MEEGAEKLKIFEDKNKLKTTKLDYYNMYYITIFLANFGGWG